MSAAAVRFRRTTFPCPGPGVVNNWPGCPSARHFFSDIFTQPVHEHDAGRCTLAPDLINWGLFLLIFLYGKYFGKNSAIHWPVRVCEEQAGFAHDPAGESAACSSVHLMVIVGLFSSLTSVWIIAWFIATQAAIAGAVIMTLVCIGVLAIYSILLLARD